MISYLKLVLSDFIAAIFCHLFVLHIFHENRCKKKNIRKEVKIKQEQKRVLITRQMDSILNLNYASNSIDQKDPLVLYYYRCFMRLAALLVLFVVQFLFDIRCDTFNVGLVKSGLFSELGQWSGGKKNKRVGCFLLHKKQ